MVTGERDWRAYEAQIHERLLSVAGTNAEIDFDAHLPGRLSGVERQVDIFIRGSFANIGEAPWRWTASASRATWT
jgi:hypothetical protein